ncbi:hypothetical protein AX774_g421 [Zancudomyces culisetae]|uniref:Uncharacterized protein n=1 Tax=Zancudomyces culisetae TaxID=1213189 RepID=A0A1R1PYM1_ZANCU|nr:hypothetical protein AX774_g421 [Zancudomyces culisetae]|eukprot:OMH86019.1 hypothetical protein AX774_g421 [Zancudomyces culisetae]
MFKSAIFSILALSSTFGHSVQKSKNKSNQAISVNGVTEIKFNQMHSVYQTLPVQLFYLNLYKLPRGTCNIKPNQCYRTTPILSFKIDSVPGNRGNLLFCRSEDCNSNCIMLDLSKKKEIDSTLMYISGGAQSMAWFNN